MSTDPDVVIIGAGAAGLSAAKALKARGLTNRVLEGSHRIGGRAYSEEIAPGVWFDLGCSYLHQGAWNPFGPIADGLGIPLNRARQDLLLPDNIHLRHNGQPLTAQDQERYEAYKAQCQTAIQASVGQGEDRAIADLIDMESDFFLPHADSLAALNTMDIDETSAADYDNWGKDDVGPSSDIPVPGGYGNLVKAWGRDVAVDLNCRVEKVNWSGKDVAVETAKGRLKARAALVTVSTGILAAQDILFNPVLPDWKVQAYLALPTGPANKIGLHFDRDIFGPEALGYYITWNDDGDVGGFEASANGNNTAIVFTGGSHSAWLEKQGQQAGQDHALSRVAEVFGNDVKAHLTRAIVTAWATEPWTLGAYSAARPGQAHQRLELAKPLDDRLFFAGEATIEGSQATCHGAYLSGLRAAEEIAAVLEQGG